MTMFSYRLMPLLRYRQSLLQPLRQTLRKTEDALTSARDILSVAKHDVAACEQALQALPPNLPLYWSAQSYIRERRLRCLELAEAAEAAERERDHALSALHNARAELRQVEKHRERQQEEAREAAQRRMYREQDDAWLQHVALGSTT